MPSLRRILLTALIIIGIWSTENCSASSPKTNLTEVTIEDNEELSSLGKDLQFRERYRRLIPYMTYYVSNNYVNPQSQSSTSNLRSRIPPTIRRRIQYAGTRNGNVIASNLNKQNKNSNQYYVSPPIQQQHQEKFIPSVQYDPTDMDSEEYFTPVIHSTKLNYQDYQTIGQQRYQTSRPVLTQTISSTGSANLRADQQQIRFTTARPDTINFSPKYGDILVRKEAAKLPAGILKQDYTSNYYQRPTQGSFKFGQGEPSFSTENYEPLRFNRPQTPQPFRLPEQTQSLSRNPSFRKPSVNLSHIVKSLQLSNQLPEMLNADNIDDSIKTLVEILSLLNSGGKNEAPLGQSSSSIAQNVVPSEYREFENYKIVQSRPKTQPKRPILGISRPIVVQDDDIQLNRKPELNNGPYHVNIIDVGTQDYYPTPAKVHSVVEQSEKPSFVESTETPNSYKIVEEELTKDALEDQMIGTPPLTTEEPALNYPPPDGSASHTQNFPPTSTKYGATRGKPDVDYPAYATIPKTQFSCTTQRYKGFFGDPDTGCQVWHYCDLNGGKSSFLCPNGTIFSQVALTCDWWFNVKCESTTQLYVLNERLYKYILPVMPKFPEDFSGPEVDRYLELKFKEMETKMKEKKLKKHQEELKKMKNSTQVQDDNTDTE